jgi:hypothetical protein
MQRFLEVYADFVNKMMHLFAGNEEHKDRIEIRSMGYETMVRYNESLQQRIYDKIPTTVACNEFRFLQAYEIREDYNNFKYSILHETNEQRFANIYLICQAMKKIMAESDMLNEKYVNKQTQTSWTSAENLVHLSDEITKCVAEVIPNIQKMNCNDKSINIIKTK